MQKIECLLPSEIEKKSFEIISTELKKMNIKIPEEQKSITLRTIHTSADFDFAKTMYYSKNSIQIAKDLIKNGADIVCDTNMAKAGINKKILEKFGGTVHCFMADEDVAQKSKNLKITRASASMEKAIKLNKPIIFAIGNAPTALISLYEMFEKKIYKPEFIIAVPVGFVNVELAKNLILETEIPCIINRGRKGGSPIAATICNALLYMLEEESKNKI